MSSPEDNGKQGTMKQGTVAPFYNPSDVLAEVQVVILKGNKCLLLSSKEDIPLILQVLAKGVEMAGQMAKKAIPERIVTVPGLPPGLAPR